MTHNVAVQIHPLTRGDKGEVVAPIISRADTLRWPVNNSMTGKMTDEVDPAAGDDLYDFVCKVTKKQELSAHSPAQAASYEVSPTE